MANGLKGRLGTFPPHSHLGPVLDSKVSEKKKKKKKVSDKVTVRASFQYELCCRRNLSSCWFDLTVEGAEEKVRRAVV